MGVSILISMEPKIKTEKEFRPIIKTRQKNGYALVVEKNNSLNDINRRKTKQSVDIQHYTILLLCILILSLLGYLTYAGQTRSQNLDYDQEVKEKLMEELIKNLLSSDSTRDQNSSDFERFGRSINTEHHIDGWRVDSYASRSNGLRVDSNNGFSTQRQTNRGSINGWRV